MRSKVMCHWLVVGIIITRGNFSIRPGSVIASEAKQSQLLQRDCHVAPLLAMTANVTGKKSSGLIEKLLGGHRSP